MFKPQAAFSGFSVDDLDRAKTFYSESLGLKVDHDEMGLTIHLPHSDATIFVYPKDDHEPATYTILNLVVDDIDEAADELARNEVVFEHYEGLPADDKGIVRGRAAKRGPDIAWFKDPAGNILSILQN